MTTTALDRPQRLATGGASSPRTAFDPFGRRQSRRAPGRDDASSFRTEHPRPDLLVGTSVGALNAAFVASRPQNGEASDAKAQRRVWRDLRRGRLSGAYERARRRCLPTETAITWCLTTVCVELVRTLTLNSMTSRTQRRPSMSSRSTYWQDARRSSPEAQLLTPFRHPRQYREFFPPVAFGDQLLIDGGVVNNTPISHAVELGAERVYVLPTQAPHDRPTRIPTGALDAAIQGVHLLVGSRLAGRRRQILGRGRV